MAIPARLLAACLAVQGAVAATALVGWGFRLLSDASPTWVRQPLIAAAVACALLGAPHLWVLWQRRFSLSDRRLLVFAAFLGFLIGASGGVVLAVWLMPPGEVSAMRSPLGPYILGAATVAGGLAAAFRATYGVQYFRSRVQA